jgi:hypothetical protein
VAARPFACRSRRKRTPALVVVASGPVAMTMMVTFHWRLVAMVVVMVVIMMLLLNNGAVICIMVVTVVIIVAFILSAVIALCLVEVVDIVECSSHENEREGLRE